MLFFLFLLYIYICIYWPARTCDSRTQHDDANDDAAEDDDDDNDDDDDDDDDDDSDDDDYDDVTGLVSVQLLVCLCSLTETDSTRPATATIKLAVS